VEVFAAVDKPVPLRMLTRFITRFIRRAFALSGRDGA
jgi:hypothetical protein